MMEAKEVPRKREGRMGKAGSGRLVRKAEQHSKNPILATRSIWGQPFTSLTGRHSWREILRSFTALLVTTPQHTSVTF